MTQSPRDTERLVGLLASDAAYRPRPVATGLLLALIPAFAVSFVVFMAALGPRPDAAESVVYSGFFDLKFVVALALAFAAIAAAVAQARPEVRLTTRVGWFAVPGLLILCGIGLDLALTSPEYWRERMIGDNALVCLIAIPALAIPLLAAALLALRRGATSRPTLSGALAGLIASGLAAALYAAHCTDDSPLFVALWYSLASAIVTFVGAVIGSRMLRY